MTALSTTEPMDAVLDSMLRPTTVAQAPSASTPPAACRAGAHRIARTLDGGKFRRGRALRWRRILASAVADGSLSDQNRAYLAQIVAQRSGLSQQEAERRVNEAFTAAREAADKVPQGRDSYGFCHGGEPDYLVWRRLVGRHSWRAAPRQCGAGQVCLRA